MKRQAGFTIIELMAVIVIIGILAATSVRLYGEYRQRVTGSEAALMMKQILDAEIIYFLENEDFYPTVADSPIEIPMAANASQDTKDNIDAIEAALKIRIPVGHNLSYTLTNYGPFGFRLTIIAEFPMFKEGYTQIVGTLDKDGNIDLIHG